MRGTVLYRASSSRSDCTGSLVGPAHSFFFSRLHNHKTTHPPNPSVDGSGDSDVGIASGADRHLLSQIVESSSLVSVLYREVIAQGLSLDPPTRFFSRASATTKPRTRPIPGSTGVLGLCSGMPAEFLPPNLALQAPPTYKTTKPQKKSHALLHSTFLPTCG